MTAPGDNKDLTLRARLMRPLVRRMLWPVLNSHLDFPARRARLERVARRTQLWLPRGTMVRPASLQGVPAEWIDNVKRTARGVALYFHGGAYTVGSAAVYRDLTARLATRCSLRVAAVDYRLAPEHPFPAAVDDALGAYRAVLDEGAPPGQVFLAGDSAGGGLAVACALKARAARLPMPAGLILFSPWVDLSLSSDSVRLRAATDLLLTSELLAAAAQAYLNGESVRAPLASPLFADLTGLPPMLVQVTDDEILADDATHLVRAAQHYDVAASLQVWPGLWHVWQGLAGKLPEADWALDQVAGFVLSRLGAAR